jgi:hypothetical protein
MKIPSQDSRSLGRDLNPRPPKYEARVLTTQPRRFVHPGIITFPRQEHWHVIKRTSSRFVP